MQSSNMWNVSFHLHQHQRYWPEIPDEHHENVQLHDVQHRIRIHCTRCTQLYFDETGRTLDTRFKEHLADIKRWRYKPVANHFNQTDHSIRVKGLWLLFTDSVNDRKDMESHLIDKLGSRKPGGMNERL